MSYIWTGMVLLSLLFACLSGQVPQVGAAALSGAAEGAALALRLAGPLLFWSGLMEIMNRSGLTARLARALRPVLIRLFPPAAEDEALCGDLCCNVSANLLGLGNAATPAGVRAAVRLRQHGGTDAASDALCRLVVLNTASLQLFPTTVAALRASLGAAEPFDILPAVWLSSLLSVTAGLLAERLFSRLT